MKKLIIASFLSLTALVSNAQNEDAQIQQIEIDIKAAAASGDYDKAAELQEKKATLIKIKEAVANGDYDLANKLKNGNSNSSSSTTGNSEIKELEAQQKQAAANGDYDKAAELGRKIDALKNGSTVVQPSTTSDSNSGGRSRRPESERNNETESVSSGSSIMKRGFFLDIMPGYGYYTSDYTGLSTFGYAFSARLGNKFYFGKSDFYRPGIQIVWGRLGFISSSVPESFGIFFAPVNVGFTNLIAFNENMGLEFNYNMGIDLHGDGLATGSIPIGWVYNPTVKFRIHKFAVGIDILYANPIGDGAVNYEGSVLYYDTGYYQYGVTAGLKF